MIWLAFQYLKLLLVVQVRVVLRHRGKMLPIVRFFGIERIDHDLFSTFDLCTTKRTTLTALTF